MTLSVGTASAIVKPLVGTWLKGYGGKNNGAVALTTAV